MFKVDNPTHSIGLQFWNLYTKWNAEITISLKPLGITHTQFVILAAILWREKTHNISSQSEISALTSIDKMTLSKALIKLVEKKFIVKNKAANDSRIFILTLTEIGAGLTKQAISIVEDIDEKIFGSLGAEKKAIFLSLILEIKSLSS